MPRKRTSEKGALELLEESVHLLRVTPLQLWVCYYIGALPFALGFLFFWADMSGNVFATQHCGRAAFGMALLFIWMKTWQSIFATELAAQIAGRSLPGWSFKRFVTVAGVQTLYQPSGLFLLPLAALIVFPAGWIFAFYQNVSALGGGETKKLFKTSVQQAALFPSQNHVGLLVVFAFALFVWLNLITFLLTVPEFLRMFLGIESFLTRSGVTVLMNTTFFSASLLLTYLCVDPLIKAFYTLRCFYGQSLATGEDLKVELRNHTSLIPNAALTLIATSLFLSITASADGSNSRDRSLAPVAASPLPVSELDASIQEVLARPEFTWRQPREIIPASTENKNWLTLLLEGVGDTLNGWLRSLRDVIRDFFEWLMKYLRPKKNPSSGGSGGDAWMTTLRISIFILITLLASALAILFLRIWKRRHRKEIILAEAVPCIPDLNDENIAANQLPEDGWLKLARDLMERGELRLALRAFYLAGLAHLAQRDFLQIARFKSNREYERELRRRARALPELQNAFGENVGAFDRTWYGLHEVTPDTLRNFQANLERIRAC